MKRTDISWTLVGALLLASSCGGGGDHSDAGTDASDASDARTDGPMACAADSDCDNGLFCDGVELCTSGFCATGDAPDCDDSDACTTDTCDEDGDECVNAVPDADGDGHAPIDCGGDDCDDTDANRFPGNVEVCDAENHDEDCDPTSFGAEDRDGDGYLDARCCNTDAAGVEACGDDCDDVHAAVHPTATETCDGFDNDCNGEVDEGVTVIVYPDTDFDGHGDDSAASEQHCADAVGFSVLNDDCDDTNPTVYTGQVEICDALDNDCDGVVDDSPIPVTWYRDADGDGFGSAASGSMESCAPIAGYTLSDGDCDDASAAINPAAAELCDGRDNNCNGVADFLIGLNDYEDDDGDGLPDIGCGAPLGVDCDDADPITGGGQPEVCDGRDNNCNGEVDEGAMDRQWFRDADGDGYGSVTSGTRVGCMPVPGFIGLGGDCNDADPARHPGATESCNGIDDDCDGSIDGSTANAECVVANAAPACIGGRCRVDRCADGFGDCDGDPTNGCEVTLSDTADHCGSCDVACAPGHSSASCVTSACVFGACDAGYADCDADASNGCETATGADVSNCGGCGTICDYTNASASCTAGGCAMGSCDLGFEDCNADPADGCEVDPSSDPNHCGDCGTVCDGALLHTTAVACSFGRCAIDAAAPACEAGWEDCDGNPFNGCETNIGADSAHCGSCGNDCLRAPNIISASCGADGVCSITSCTSGRADCDRNPTNGCETDTNGDQYNCGACDTQCVSAALHVNSGVCVSSTCQPIGCALGWEDCDGNPANGCELDVRNDALNCGSCGNDCTGGGAMPGSTCTGSTCNEVCPLGLANCDGDRTNGCEANLNTDITNCRSCGNVCPSGGTATAECTSGSCGLLCAGSLRDCDGNPTNGCEVNLGMDPAHCGSCGNDCLRAPNVVSASCGAGGICTITSCTGGRADCDGNPTNGCEADTNGDQLNCGICGTQCSTLPHVDTGVCGSGTCQPVRCTPGWEDCDGLSSNGCETDVQNDSRNCGFCGDDCTGGGAMPGSTCIGGTCNQVCPTGLTNCDGNPTNGCEADLNMDVSNCGSCGNVCPSGGTATAECTSGFCGLLCTGSLQDCDGNPTNGCEADVQNDPMNCGGCGLGFACPSGPNAWPGCTLGTCGTSCDPGFADCNGTPGDGCEVNIDNDPANCGGCGLTSKCALPNVDFPTCFGGSCDIGSCAPGFADCDVMASTGCEVNTDTDPTNCGVCDISCGAAGVCSAGMCDGAIDVSVGLNHSCAVRASGAVICWGDDVLGQLGDGGTVASNVPVDTGLRGMRSVSAGGTHTCAVSASSGDIYCWGDNSLGQLGTPAMTSGTPPSVPVDRTPLGTSEGFIVVAAGMNHTCALTNQSRVFCWGDDTRGALGDSVIGSPAFSTTPVLANLGTTAQPTLIASGDGFSCAFDLSVGGGGNVKCWGAGDVGQLGKGTLADSPFPAAVAGSVSLAGTVQLVAGARHACARTTSGGGSLACWGDNSTMAITSLGAGPPTPSQTVPFQIGLTYVQQVMTLRGATCALAGGDLQCWGDNLNDRLGVGLADPQNLPASLQPTPFSPLSLPADGGLGGHQCVLVGNGVSCWGDNAFGQVGVVSGGVITTPSPVIGLTP